MNVCDFPCFEVYRKWYICTESNASDIKSDGEHEQILHFSEVFKIIYR